MADWTQPHSVRALHIFLSLVGYYRWFIQGYGSITVPLTCLLSKDDFLWSEEVEAAFQELKRVLTSASAFQLPNFA